MTRSIGRLFAVATALALTGCSRSSGRDPIAAPARTARGAADRALDFAHPLEALFMSGDAMAARVGSFAWSSEVVWNVSKPGITAVKAVEHHRVRQVASGDFEVSSEIDPGSGPGGVTGRDVVFAAGTTYGRGRWAPFRGRPTDRGNEARRARDETLRSAAALAELYGPALIAEPAGETTFSGRRARRYRLALTGTAPVANAPPPGLPDGGYDPDTRRHVAFLEGRVPAAATGELLLDEATGVPLSVVMKGSFSERDDPQLRADVELTARVDALGAHVAAVQPPKDALADEGKPGGVARALEAAGLRQRSSGRAREEGETSDEE